jgi:hypothetical protein
MVLDHPAGGQKRIFRDSAAVIRPGSLSSGSRCFHRVIAVGLSGDAVSLLDEIGLPVGAER